MSDFDLTSEDDSLNSVKGGRLSVVPEESDSNCDTSSKDDDEKPVGVELLAALCFSICAGLLSIPFFVDDSNPYSFTMSLILFLIYEWTVGLYIPCKGGPLLGLILRLYFKSTGTPCSVLNVRPQRTARARRCSVIILSKLVLIF